MQYIPVLNTVGMEILYQFERRWCKLKKLTPYRAMLFLLSKLHQFQTIYFMKDKDIHYRPDKTWHHAE